MQIRSLPILKYLLQNTKYVRFDDHASGGVSRLELLLRFQGKHFYTSHVASGIHAVLAAQSSGFTHRTYQIPVASTSVDRSG